LPISGGRAVGIVRSRTQATEFSFSSHMRMLQVDFNVFTYANSNITYGDAQAHEYLNRKVGQSMSLCCHGRERCTASSTSSRETVVQCDYTSHFLIQYIWIMDSPISCGVIPLSSVLVYRRYGATCCSQGEAGISSSLIAICFTLLSCIAYSSIRMMDDDDFQRTIRSYFREGTALPFEIFFRQFVVS
jgi:hypothetical protein